MQVTGRQGLALPNGRDRRLGPMAVHRRLAVAVSASSAGNGADECSTSGSSPQPAKPLSNLPIGSAARVRLLSGLSAAAVIVPSFGGVGGNGNSNNGGGGGGGGGGGAGAEGWFSSVQSLFDLAAGKEDESSDSSSDAKEGDKPNPWKKLVTESGELEGGNPDNRVGTNRCVEIVIEGWPNISTLPSAVGARDFRGEASRVARRCLRMRLCGSPQHAAFSADCPTP